MNGSVDLFLTILLKYVQNRRQVLMMQHLRRHCEFLEKRKIAYQRRKIRKHLLSTQFSIPRRFFSLLVPRCRRFMKRPRNQNHWNTLQEPQNKEIFFESFRMSHDAFHLLCIKLKPFLQITYNCTLPPLAIEQQVAICIYKLSTCAEYRVVGDVFGVHKSTVHKYFHRVIDAILALKNEYITFPKLEEALVIADEFEKLSHIPNIIGAIDGTHIPMLPPKTGHLDYINRKGWPSIIMQAVVDNNYMFRDVCVKFPGSTHDAAVFKQSGLYKNAPKLIPKHVKEVSNIQMPLFIIGDPAYPLLPWLMKPYIGALNKEEESFNCYLSSARIVVENAFGRLKGRWRAICKRIDVMPEFVPKVVLACAILHNFVEQNKQQYLHVWSNGAGTHHEYIQPYNSTSLQIIQENNLDPKELRNELKNYLKNNFPLRRSQC